MAERNAPNSCAQAPARGPRLFRTCKDGRASISGFLEDYALVIQAYISLYEVTFAEKWLREAEAPDATTCWPISSTPPSSSFSTPTATPSRSLPAKKSCSTTCIPASNSVMAHNLRRLGRHLEDAEYLDLAAAMLAQVQALVVKEPQHLTNWACLYAALLRPGAEMAIGRPRSRGISAGAEPAFSARYGTGRHRTGQHPAPAARPPAPERTHDGIRLPQPRLPATGALGGRGAGAAGLACRPG